jgi:hypothetical protein
MVFKPNPPCTRSLIVHRELSIAANRTRTALLQSDGAAPERIIQQIIPHSQGTLTFSPKELAVVVDCAAKTDQGGGI